MQSISRGSGRNRWVSLTLKPTPYVRFCKQLGTWVQIPKFTSRYEYFSGFSEILKTTDILWTKPSELSFYTGLGLPIVIAPPIGSQEDFNRLWLQYVGGGIPQNDPKYTNEWLFDWIRSGGMGADLG